MPLVPYAPPALRSPRTANPFDQIQPQRLRLLIDQPLSAGPVDGEGEFRGYPYLGSGSTGFPDTAAVLRSYFNHPSLEILRVSDELEEVGDVVVGEPYSHPERDMLPVRSKTATGLTYTGLDYYTEAVNDANTSSARYGIGQDEALAGELLDRIGAVLDTDLVVTDRQWLLAKRDNSRSKFLASVVSPQEALGLIGLYLRWHHQPIIIAGAETNWHPTSMRHSAAFIAMPAFERWNQAGRAWHDNTANHELTLENLNQTLLTRISRAFHFRDSIFALSATMADYEPEEMLCELDSLLFSLVGAFDIAARITDYLLGLRTSGIYGWQHTGSGKWQAKLEPHAKPLFDHTKAGTEMQRNFEVLRWLRNSVHNEALDLTRDNGTFYVTVAPETQHKLREFLRAGHPGWTTAALGVIVQHPGGATAGKWLPGTGRYSVTVQRTGAPKPTDPLDGQLILDVRRLVNKLFPACLTDLNTIMQLTPLTKVPGHTPALDTPLRVNLPWPYSDTTGHRMRMLYGITELP
jgi:hypothetical protein